MSPQRRQTIRLRRRLRGGGRLRRELREKVAEAQNHHCCYCGARGDLTLEHVQPVAYGGRSTRDNCVAACEECNFQRGHSNAFKFWYRKQRELQLA